MSELNNKFRSRRRVLAAATVAVLASFGATSAFAQAKLNMAGLEGGEGAYDGFIVKYRDGSAAHGNVARMQQAVQRAAARALPAQAQGRAIGLRHERRLSVGADVIRPTRKLDRVEAEQLMRQIATDPDVEYVELDLRMYPTLTPNDTHYGVQYGYGSGAGGMRADQAWDKATGTGIVVAVLDTGITNHSDLNANVLPGYDFISDASRARDGNGRDSNPRDEGDWITANQCGGSHAAQNSSWHGTHVAGTVAAVTNNSRGVAGTAPNARIVPVRVLGACGGSSSDIADAIVWASGGSVSGVPTNQNPAEVINMSLGSSVPATCSMTYQSAINGAVNRGTVVVTAAGNSNTTANHPPGNCPNVINVAATTETGSRASFSNYGSRIHVSAPGDRIASTVNTGSTTPSSEGYSYMSGTSMAAPHVAGVVALIQSAASTPRSPSQILQILQSTARALPGACSGGCGAGIVNAKAAVDAVSGGGGPGPGPGPVDPNQLQNGVPVTGIYGSSGTERRYTVQVPSGRSQLRIVMSGGSGDADMYVRYGSAPTTSSYNCRPFRYGNNESCTFSAPPGGTFHIMVRGYSTFSGVSLVATY
ncbi:MAG: S8 family peptidase [Pseudoxanthomonas suwonensis]|nr:S8 family peptidase [Pseudoxanthomonas suwonensis]